MNATAQLLYKKNIVQFIAGSVTTTFTTMLPHADFGQSEAGGNPVPGTTVTVLNGSAGGIDAIFNETGGYGGFSLGQTTLTLAPACCATFMFGVTCKWFRVSSTVVQGYNWRNKTQFCRF